MQKEAKKFNVSQFGIKPFGSRINLSKKEAGFPFLTSAALTMKTLAKQSIFAGSQIFHVCTCLHSRKITCMNTCRAANLAPCGCYYQRTMVAAARSWCSTFSTHQRGTQSKPVDCWHSSVVVQIPVLTTCLGQWSLSCKEQQRLLQHWISFSKAKPYYICPAHSTLPSIKRRWTIWKSWAS